MSGAAPRRSGAAPRRSGAASQSGAAPRQSGAAPRQSRRCASASSACSSSPPPPPPPPLPLPPPPLREERNHRHNMLNEPAAASTARAFAISSGCWRRKEPGGSPDRCRCAQLSAACRAGAALALPPAAEAGTSGVAQEQKAGASEVPPLANLGKVPPSLVLLSRKGHTTLERQRLRWWAGGRRRYLSSGAEQQAVMLWVLWVTVMMWVGADHAQQAADPSAQGGIRHPRCGRPRRLSGGLCTGARTSSALF